MPAVYFACAFTHIALVLAGSLAYWTALAIAVVALDRAVSSAFRTVFHFP
jgi:hypothetical protein